jgi:hypothetical protein
MSQEVKIMIIGPKTQGLTGQAAYCRTKKMWYRGRLDALFG